MYKIEYTKEAENNLRDLKKKGDIAKLKKIKDAISKIQQDPRHPGLHTHKYQSFQTKNGEDVFQSYVENHTPSSYRIFWYYGPQSGIITIIAVTPHP